MTIPIYKIVINEYDESGCTAVSLVENPAVELPFLCFDKQEKIELSINDDKRVISGIAMLADTPIYRYTQQRGEYYIVFTKETIRQMVSKFAKNEQFNIVNLQHDKNTYVDCCHLIESLIIDKERGLCPTEFANVPDGSWYVSYHIEDEALWNEIKNGGHLNGFSIEVLSGLELIENKSQNKNMNKFFKLAKAIMKLAEVKTDKETLIIRGEIAVGEPVFIETEEGPIEAPDGEYTLEDGTVLVVAAGLIAEIKEVEKKEELEEEEIPVDNKEVDELKARIAELEAEIAEKDAYIAELEGKITEQEESLKEANEKLKMSVEKPITKSVNATNRENKALKYFN